MMSVWAPLALTATTGAMIALPLAPALLEAIRRKDARPLPTRKDDGNIRNFARSFRRYIEPLQPDLASCAARNSIVESRLADGAYVLLVGKDGMFDVPEDTVQTLALFAKQSSIPDNLAFTRDVYAAHALYGGKRNCFRALLGEEDIYLGEESCVLRWVHAEGKIVAGPRSWLLGRASSEKTIHISQGCTFERTHAPAIFTSLSGEFDEAVSANPLPEKVHKLGQSRINGDLHLGSGEMLLGNIIVTGSIQVDERTRIFGSAKGNGNIELREQAEVQGSLISTKKIHMAANCCIKGPVLAEDEIVIGAGTQIGTPTSPTTVSAPRIRIAPDCVVHGTLWARVEGRVEA
jgi:hypothetical protein